jgi:hypothetical protein
MNTHLRHKTLAGKLSCRKEPNMDTPAGSLNRRPPAKRSVVTGGTKRRVQFVIVRALVPPATISRPIFEQRTFSGVLDLISSLSVHLGLNGEYLNVAGEM